MAARSLAPASAGVNDAGHGPRGRRAPLAPTATDGFLDAPAARATMAPMTARQPFKTRLLAPLFLAGLALPSPAWASPPSGQPAPSAEISALRHLRTVVLDPGHGGDNRGCLGVDGTFEKVVVLQIAQRVERILLEETSAAVLMTRREDRPLGLRERTRLANAWGADVFLSLHANADPLGRGHGVETWFLSADDAEPTEAALRLVALEEAGDDPEEVVDAVRASEVEAILRDAALHQERARSEALGEAVATAMHKATGARLRGVHQARFGVLVEAEMPAIVVEAGFLTHRDEGLALLEPAYQERIARAIVDGLVAFDRRLGEGPTVSAR